MVVLDLSGVEAKLSSQIAADRTRRNFRAALIYHFSKMFVSD